MSVFSDEEIWTWYNHIKDHKNSGLSTRQYCENHGLKLGKYYYMHNRIVYNSESSPKKYAKLVEITKKHMKKGSPASEFFKQNDIDKRTFQDVRAHLEILDMIDNRKKEDGAEPMKFVAVPRPKINIQHQQDVEVIESKNTIEMVVSLGVKVVISPEVSTDKIFKIIQLLKDL